MYFFLKHLEETLGAINKLIENNISIVNTKLIRRYNNIKSSNRSKINFIWRSLKFLDKKGIIREFISNNSKIYKIKSKSIINIEEFISQVKKRNIT